MDKVYVIIIIIKDNCKMVACGSVSKTRVEEKHVQDSCAVWRNVLRCMYRHWQQQLQQQQQQRQFRYICMLSNL